MEKSSLIDEKIAPLLEITSMVESACQNLKSLIIQQKLDFQRDIKFQSTTLLNLSTDIDAMKQTLKWAERRKVMAKRKMTGHPLDRGYHQEKWSQGGRIYLFIDHAEELFRNKNGKVSPTTAVSLSLSIKSLYKSFSEPINCWAHKYEGYYISLISFDSETNIEKLLYNAKLNSHWFSKVRFEILRSREDELKIANRSNCL